MLLCHLDKSRKIVKHNYVFGYSDHLATSFIYKLKTDRRKVKLKIFVFRWKFFFSKGNSKKNILLMLKVYFYNVSTDSRVFLWACSNSAPTLVINFQLYFMVLGYVNNTHWTFSGNWELFLKQKSHSIKIAK